MTNNKGHNCDLSPIMVKIACFRKSLRILQSGATVGGDGDTVCVIVIYVIQVKATECVMMVHDCTDTAPEC